MTVGVARYIEIYIPIYMYIYIAKSLNDFVSTNNVKRATTIFFIYCMGHRGKISFFRASYKKKFDLVLTTKVARYSDSNYFC